MFTPSRGFNLWRSLGGKGGIVSPLAPPVVRGEGSERAPPVCKWGVLRASNREGNCLWVSLYQTGEGFFLGFDFHRRGLHILFC